MAYKSKLRLFLLMLAFVVVLGFYGYRLFRLQIVDRPTEDVRSDTYTYETRVTAARGEILDRNGNVLVSNRASYNLIITNYALFSSDDPNESLRKLVALGRQLGVEFTDHLPVSAEKPYVYTTDQLDSAWNYYYREFLDHYDWDPDVSAPQLIKLMRARFHIPNDWSDEDVRGVLGLRFELDLRYYTSLSTYVLMRDVGDTQRDELSELGTPGLSVVTSTERVYNTAYAAHILGHVGPMSAAQYEVYKEKGYAMDAYVGQDGFERVFEEQLHGTDGWLKTTIDRNGNVVSQHYETLPVAGKNVELTIDINLQIAAEEALESTILSLRENGLTGAGDGKDARGGAVVVIDVRNGQVLACASYPTYNLSTYSKDFNELVNDEYSPLFNRALDATYPPGSTFKMVTTIAALDTGTINRYYAIEDRGIYRYYEGYQPACYYYTATHMTHGIVDVDKALAVSCNYFFYDVGRQTGWAEIDKVAQKLGLGEPTGVEISENVGHRGNPDAKKEVYKDYPDLQPWTGGDTLSLSIGQSENRFSPLQLAVYTSALANRGVRYKATFLSRIISADYQELLEETRPRVLSRLTISDDAYDAYTSGMRQAVTRSNGTANKVFGDYEIPVCAKTGTAQHGSSGSDHASYVCYAPADDPQLAVAVYVENGAQGGNLGYVAKAVFDLYFATEYANDTVHTENTVG